MKNQDDNLPESLRAAACDYNAPPELDRSERDAMWFAIEGEAFPNRFLTPTAERKVPRAESRFSARSLLPLAAVLLVGVAIGRFGLPHETPAPVTVAVDAPADDSLAVPQAYQKIGRASRRER